MRGKYEYSERPSASGALNHNATLEPSDYGLIMGLLADGMPRRTVAEKFEISKTTLQRIIAGTHWLCRQQAN